MSQMSQMMMPKAPVHTEIESDEVYKGLDAGIRFAVKALHYAGIPTVQSCQGGEGHSYRYPSIDMVDGGRAFGAMEVLQSYGIQVRSVSSIWRVYHGVPDERIWRIELVHDVIDRVTDRPMFITGHLSSELWEPNDLFKE